MPYSIHECPFYEDCQCDATAAVGDSIYQRNLENKVENSKFDFIYAPRFWAMVIASAGTVFLDPSFPLQPWYVSLGKFLALVGGGFTLVGTVDKYGDKQIMAAGVAKGTVAAEDVVKMPPTE